MADPGGPRLEQELRPLAERRELEPRPMPTPTPTRRLSADAAIGFAKMDGFQGSLPRLVLFIVACIFSGGTLFIFCTWYPKYFTILARKRCPVPVATHILVTGTFGVVKEVEVKRVVLRDEDDGVNREQRFIEFCTVRYVWTQGAFQPCEYDTAISYGRISEMKGGLDGAEYTRRARTYGTNVIDIPVDSVAKLLYEKCLHPFYLFQVFSCILWYAEEYSYYATTILVSSVASVAWEVHRAHSNAVNLRKAARQEIPVRVLRDGKEATVSSSELAPGDVIEVEGDAPVPADMVLLSGECIVDESMLTGESTPLAKQALPCLEKPEEWYAADRHKTYSLYCGSRVLQVKAPPGQPVRALVMRTGFSTAKGQLFRAILYPKPVRFKFAEDSYKFLAFMAVAAIILCIVNIVIKVKRGMAAPGEVTLSSLDLLTIAVPPALPLVLTMGTGFALGRLNRQRVFCIAPQRINFAGRIDTMMFDKTGTLTHDSLDFYAAHGAVGGRFASARRAVRPAADCRDPMLQFMATCHALVRISGEAVGHPVDVKMFHTAAWEMVEPDRSREAQRAALAVLVPPAGGDPALATAVLRRFEFDVRLQRSAVLVRVGEGPAAVHLSRVKGSLEAVRPLCRPETLPTDLDKVLREYTRKGLYVLACAQRALPHLDDAAAAAYKREEAEADLSFLGLLVLQNALKAESAGVIKRLLDARIQPLLVTGDAALTAVCVARELALVEAGAPVFLLDAHSGKLHLAPLDRPDEPVDLPSFLERRRGGAELAVTGAAMAALGPGETLNTVVRRAKVFGRVLPEQKALIAETLIEVHGRYVGMCGDGTNDCGALKAAHIGLSLSEAEASIVAPFTSADKRVESIVDLLREGRCALVTSFVAFKYMAIYPLVQLFMVVRLYLMDHTLGDWQYLFDDLALVLPLGVLMCLTGPAATLVRERPVSSLFSAGVLASLFGQIVITGGFLAGGNLLLASAARARPELFSQGAADAAVLRDGLSCPLEMGNAVCSFENTVSWAFGHFQFLTLALAFSVGRPFRRPMYTNLPYTIFALVVTVIMLLILLAPSPVSARIFLLLPLPPDLRWALAGLAAANAVAYALWEWAVIAADGWRQNRRLLRVAAAEAGLPELPGPAAGGEAGPGLRETVAQALARSASPTLRRALGADGPPSTPPGGLGRLASGYAPLRAEGGTGPPPVPAPTAADAALAHASGSEPEI